MNSSFKKRVDKKFAIFIRVSLFQFSSPLPFILYFSRKPAPPALGTHLSWHGRLPSALLPVAGILSQLTRAIFCMLLICALECMDLNSTIISQWLLFASCVWCICHRDTKESTNSRVEALQEFSLMASWHHATAHAWWCSPKMPLLSVEMICITCWWCWVSHVAFFD